MPNDSLESLIREVDRKNLDGMARIEGRLGSVETTTAHIKNLITGNGHPEDGLLFKVAQLRDSRRFWAKAGWGAFGAAGLALAEYLFHLLK